MVALYTAAVAILVGGTKEPSAADPSPSEYVLLRWLLAISVVAITAFAVHQTAKGKQDAGKQRRPGAEVLAGGFAAAGWALALPELSRRSRCSQTAVPCRRSSRRWRHSSPSGRSTRRARGCSSPRANLVLVAMVGRKTDRPHPEQARSIRLRDGRALGLALGVAPTA